MQVCGPVQAEPHCETGAREKATPFVVQEGSVRDQAVHNPFLWWSVFLLNCDYLPEVVDAEYCGLATVPGKSNRAAGREGDLLDDVLLHEFLVHFESTGVGV